MRNKSIGAYLNSMFGLSLKTKYHYYPQNSQDAQEQMQKAKQERQRKMNRKQGFQR